MSASTPADNANAKKPTSSRGRGGNPFQGPPRPAPKPKTNLVLQGVQDVKVTGNQGIPGNSFVIVVADSNSVSSITFHPPIGVNKLTKEDWVATPTEDVPTLVANAKHPDLTAHAKVINMAKENAAIGAGLLARTGTIVHYPGDSTTSRADRLKVATDAAKQTLAEGVMPNAEAITAKLPKNPVDLQVAERTLQAYYGQGDVKSYLKETFPLKDYETKSGPTNDRPQKPLPHFKGKSSREVRAILMASLYGTEYQSPVTRVPEEFPTAPKRRTLPLKEDE